MFHLHDPDHTNLRRALRVTLVMPLMTFLGNVVFHSAAFSTFGAFGALALLGFSNFAGPLRVRFGLGLAFTATSTAVVAVGTLAASDPLASVALVFTIAFSATFASQFGGYAAAGTRGLILAGILAVMVPVSSGTAGDRVLGWLVAGLVSSLAMVVLWPGRPRPRLRLELADIARHLAARLRSAGREDADRAEDLLASVRHLREQIESTLSRPAGPRSRDQALMYVLAELGRAAALLGQLQGLLDDEGPALEEHDLELLAHSARALEAAADLLSGLDADPPIAAMARLRDRELREVADALTDSRPERSGFDGPAPSSPQDLLTRFDVLFPVRMLSYLGMSIATNAMVAVGRHPSHTDFEFRPDAPNAHQGHRVVARRVTESLRANLTPRSRWFRDGLQFGVALGGATLVAQMADLGHAYWVAMGSLSILRSSVLDTGATALKAIFGTLAGFAAAGILLAAVGDHRTALAVLLPAVIFTAMYLRGAASFVVGQAAFTVMALVQFNLSDPVGAAAGVLRLERVGLGGAISVLVALVMWPRGVSRGLAAAVAREYRSASSYLSASLRRLLHGTGGGSGGEQDGALTDVQGVAASARDAAEAELGGYMNSRGTKRLSVDTWAKLVAQGGTLILGADSLVSVADDCGPLPSHPASRSVDLALRSLDTAATEVIEPLEGRAQHLAQVSSERRSSTGGADLRTRPIDQERVAAARAGLAELLADPAALAELTPAQVLALLWSLQWLTYLGLVARQAVDELEAAHEALSRSWWY